MQRRSLHIASSLPFNVSLGIGKFLSPKTVDLMTAMQQKNIDYVNALTKGTAMETMNLYQLMDRIKTDSSNASLFSAASQVWNTDFFLQGLTSEPTPMVDKLLQLIEDRFGSLQKFKEQFGKYAEAMNGSGWLWLMKENVPGDEKTRLRIQCTFSTSSPLYHAVNPPSFLSLSGRPQHSKSNAESPNLFANFSFTNFNYDKGKAQAPPTPQDLSHLNNIIAQSSSTPIDSRVPPNSKLMPLLGLNLWEHAYVLDYGADKQKYVNNYWDAINWNRVAVMLNLY